MIPELTRLRIIHTCLGCRPGKMKQESYFDSFRRQNRKINRAACNQNLRTKNNYIVKKYWNFEIGIQIYISVTTSELICFFTL